MHTATDFLDAFNNSFSENNKSHLDAVLADDCTIHFTGLGQIMSKQELLDSLETNWCHGCNDYSIIRDEADSIAGTHMAWGNGDDGAWKSKSFFFATKANGKITKWYVHARPVEE